MVSVPSRDQLLGLAPYPNQPAPVAAPAQPVSLLKSIGNALGSVAKGVAKAAIGSTGVGAALLGARSAVRAVRKPSSPVQRLASPTAGAASMALPALPVLAGAGAIASRYLGAAVTRAPAIVRAGAATVARAYNRLPKWGKAAAQAAGYTVVGTAVFDSSGQQVGTTGGRRMNPMNAKAARRAIRRIKSVRKILTNIEKSLPKARRRS